MTAEGFFVELSKNRHFSGGAKGKTNASWKAMLAGEMSGWQVTAASTPEEAMRLQKEQYHARQAANQPVPRLVTARDSPMASGRMTRFVEV